MNKGVILPLLMLLLSNFVGFALETSNDNLNKDNLLLNGNNYTPGSSLLAVCPTSVTNNSISTSDPTSICAGDFVSFTGTEPIITPSTDSTFQWQSKTSLGSWTDIPDATNKDYSTESLTETTSFRRLVVFADCVELFVSNEIQINVTPTPSTPTITVQNNCGESVLTASNFIGTLSWSTGESSESITVDVAGEYSVTQTVDGCTSDAAVATASPKAIPQIVDVSETNPTVCEGQGSLEFSFANVADGTYDIDYNGGSFLGVVVSDNSATVQAPARTYNNFTITVNECTSVENISASLSDPNPPSPPTITVQNNCGESVLTASNYTGTLSWSTGESTESITVDVAGEYSVTQTVDGCTSDAAVATAAPKVIPQIVDVSGTNPIVCEGQGSLEFTFDNIVDGTYNIDYNGGSFSNVEIADNVATVQASAGTYNNLTITVDGCISESEVNASLSDPNPPSAPTITVQNNCGESVLTASNYTGTLSWSTGESTESITVDVAGEYSVTQTIDGCTSNAATATATPKTTPVIVNITENDPIFCQGSGALGFTFSGVPGGIYDIEYDGGSFSNVLIALNAATVLTTAGTYSNLTITVDGCASESGVTASLSDPNPPPAPTITVQNNCGESVLIASNYTGTLQWSTGESTESITVTTSGDYSLTQIIDGCTSDAAVATAAPNAIPQITNIAETNPTVCEGQGTLEFTFTDVANGKYDIDYSSGSFSNVVVSNNTASVQAPAGTYNNLTITVDGCTSASGVNASLSDPNPPPTPTITVQNDCGESVLTASNYTGTLNWSTGENTESITVTSAGNYSVTQTVDGCTSNAASVSVSIKPIPAISNIVENDPEVCQGTGTLEFSFTNVPNGTYSIFYDGSNFSNVSVVNNSATVEAPAGTYNNITITVGGCVSASGVNASLSDPNPPPAPKITVQNNCGESVLTASNYTGTLQWSTGESTESITVTTSGDYGLTQIIDGCTSDAAVATAAPKAIPQITNIAETNPTVCEGQGTLEFTFTDVANGKYDIDYSSGSFSNVVVSNNTASVQAPAGTYNNLTITVDGCTSASGVDASLSDPNPPPTPTITVQNDCGESVLTASNYTGTLNWSTGENTESINVTSAGNYSVTQTVDGCTSNAASVSVSIKPIPAISNIVENDPEVCQGTGTLEFSFINVPDGTYSIFYDGSSFSNVLVENNIATIEASAGTYNNLTIIVSGCASEDGINASLSDPNPPTAPTITVNDSCGVSILTASDYEGTLQWSTGENTESISVTIAGNYSLTQIIDGCTSDAATALASPKIIPEIVNISTNNPENCLGQGSLVFTFAGVPDGIYNIDYDGGTFSDVSVSDDTASIQTSAGTYNNLTITLDGCISSDGINITVTDPIPPSIPTIVVDDVCGESVLTATDYTGNLIWSTGDTTESIIVDLEGEYKLVQTLNGCVSDTAVATATPKAIPEITNILESDPEVCQGNGTLEFTFSDVPDGSYSIFYDGGSFTDISVIENKATVLTSAGTYNNLTITVDECPSPEGVNASLSDPNPPPTPSITVQNNCGESILTASDYSGSLKWSTGETTESIVVTTAGNYSLSQIIDGCTSNAANARATPKTIPEIVNVTANEPEDCLGQGSLDFTFLGVPNGTYSINFDGGAFNNIIVSENSATVQASSGNYNNITITVNGCSSEERPNVEITAPEPPATPVITVEDNCGESILTASGYTGTLFWSTGEDSEVITVNNAGQYSLTQTIDGCTSEAATAIASPKVTPEITQVTAVNPLVCQGEGTLEFLFSNVPDGTYTISYDGNSFTNVSVVNNTASVQATARMYNNLTITVDGCTSAKGMSASLSDPTPPPTPSILVENYCGESVLTALNYTGTLTWDTGDTTESITVYDAREYSLTQTVDGCTSNAATVIANPEKGSLKPEVEVVNFCGESQITITNLDEGAWLFWQHNNQIDSTQSTTITVSDEGEYIIYQKQGNCLSQDTTVIAMPYVVPAPPIAGNKEICATEPFQQLVAEASSSGANTDVIWFDSETGGNVVQSPNLNEVGTVTYYAEAINNLTGCTSESRTPVTLTIKENAKYVLVDTAIVGKPKSHVAVLLFPKDSLKYQWFLNGNEIIDATNQYYYITEDDRENGNNFSLEVELENGCKTIFNYPYNEVNENNEPVAFKSSELINQNRLFAIYPNPVNNYLNIAANSKDINYDSKLHVKIFSIDGVQVLTSELDQNPKNIDITKLKTGFYTLVIYENENRLTVEKLVVTKH